MDKYINRFGLRFKLGHKFSKDELTKVTFYNNVEDNQTLVVAYIHDSFFLKHHNLSIYRYTNKHFNSAVSTPEINEEFLNKLNELQYFEYLCNPDSENELAFNVYTINKQLLMSQDRTLGCLYDFYKDKNETEIFVEESTRAIVEKPVKKRRK